MERNSIKYGSPDRNTERMSVGRMAHPVSVRCDRSDGEPLLSIMSMIDNGHLEALHDGHEGTEEAVLV